MSSLVLGKLFEAGQQSYIYEYLYRHTFSRINFKHALDSSLMNSVSSSLSVYHGPPVTAVEGSRWKRMYVFLVGYFVREALSLICTLSDSRKSMSTP